MNILAFGVTREILGESSLILSAEQILTVGDLRKYLAETYPQLKNLNSLAIAVNEEYADDTLPLEDNDVIALIPPVSGG